ncbi:hypothetical protein HOK51_03830 [Candidatus Woesearchaeota archaeon]|jgi:hypothetical protein|nr:hypothetical protein [Candidatus Woesearchaeota archaeon]MBT6518952.1 hypothetical protein [Candidatus Woesearchaeota archaeon]MBT7368317.1 hypothetical protein [Candidatus Woesearchaeota archaeon]
MKSTKKDSDGPIFNFLDKIIAFSLAPVGRMLEKADNSSYDRLVSDKIEADHIDSLKREGFLTNHENDIRIQASTDAYKILNFFDDHADVDAEQIQDLVDRDVKVDLNMLARYAIGLGDKHLLQGATRHGYKFTESQKLDALKNAVKYSQEQEETNLMENVDDSNAAPVHQWLFGKNAMWKEFSRMNRKIENHERMLGEKTAERKLLNELIYSQHTQQITTRKEGAGKQEDYSENGTFEKPLDAVSSKSDIREFLLLKSADYRENISARYALKMGCEITTFIDSKKKSLEAEVAASVAEAKAKGEVKKTVTFGAEQFQEALKQYVDARKNESFIQSRIQTRNQNRLSTLRDAANYDLAEFILNAESLEEISEFEERYANAVRSGSNKMITLKPTQKIIMNNGKLEMIQTPLQITLGADPQSYVDIEGKSPEERGQELEKLMNLDPEERDEQSDDCVTEQYNTQIAQIAKAIVKNSVEDNLDLFYKPEVKTDNGTNTKEYTRLGEVIARNMEQEVSEKLKDALEHSDSLLLGGKQNYIVTVEKNNNMQIMVLPTQTSIPLVQGEIEFEYHNNMSGAKEKIKECHSDAIKFVIDQITKQQEKKLSDKEVNQVIEQNTDAINKIAQDMFKNYCIETATSKVEQELLEQIIKPSIEHLPEKAKEHVLTEDGKLTFNGDLMYGKFLRKSIERILSGMNIGPSKFATKYKVECGNNGKISLEGKVVQPYPYEIRATTIEFPINVNNDELSTEEIEAKYQGAANMLAADALLKPHIPEEFRKLYLSGNNGRATGLTPEGQKQYGELVQQYKQHVYKFLCKNMQETGKYAVKVLIDSDGDMVRIMSKPIQPEQIAQPN